MTIVKINNRYEWMYSKSSTIHSYKLNRYVWNMCGGEEILLSTYNRFPTLDVIDLALWILASPTYEELLNKINEHLGTNHTE